MKTLYSLQQLASVTEGHGIPLFIVLFSDIIFPIPTQKYDKPILTTLEFPADVMKDLRQERNYDIALFLEVEVQVN